MTLPVSTQATTYTFQQTDDGSVIRSISASTVTWTLPNNLTLGFNAMVIQAGAGKVTFSAASGATLENRQSLLGTAGQWAIVSLTVDTNVGGTAADYILAGDVG